jgi:hypothetical protein
MKPPLQPNSPRSPMCCRACWIGGLLAPAANTYPASIGSAASESGGLLWLRYSVN